MNRKELTEKNAVIQVARQEEIELREELQEIKGSVVMAVDITYVS